MSASIDAIERSGTRSIERALRVLRELATQGEHGWRLCDLASRCEMDRGTAHRVLACLVRERFVHQRSGDRHYFLGPMIHELASSQPDHWQFRSNSERRLAALAEQTHAIAWLLLRSGNDYVCSIRRGELDLRGFMVKEGTRRPLFTSVGGAAVFLTLPRVEERAIIDSNTQVEIARRGEVRLADLERMRDRSRRHGFGVNLGDVVPGVHAFAVPIRGADGRGVGAVCLTGSAEQFPAGRLDEIRDRLEATAAPIELEAGERLLAALPQSSARNAA